MDISNELDDKIEKKLLLQTNNAKILRFMSNYVTSRYQEIFIRCKHFSSSTQLSKQKNEWSSSHSLWGLFLFHLNIF